MIRSERLLWLLTAGAILFYFRYVYRFALDVPFWDDYDAVLLSLSTLHESGDWLRYLLKPHNEHVIFWVRLAAWLQVLVQGEVNFRQLIMLGNGFIVGLFALWWLIIVQSLRGATSDTLPLAYRQAGIALVSALLLFTIAYWESNLWAMAALSNFPVLFFAIAAFLVYHRNDSTACFLGAALLCVCAALGQANGLFAFVVIGLHLVLARQWRRVLLWAAFSVAAFAAYIALRQWTPIHAVRYPASLLEIGLFFVRFVGSFIPHLYGALALGLAILALLGTAYALRRRELTPVLQSVVLFLLITAAITAYSRVSAWAEGAMASRYAINALLLMLAVLCAYAHSLSASKQRLAAVIVLAAAINITDYANMRMKFVWRYVESEKMQDPGMSCDKYFTYPDQDRGREIYQQSEQLGIYHVKMKPGPQCEAWGLDVAAGVKIVPLAAGYGGKVATWEVNGRRLVASGWLDLHDFDVAPKLLVSVPNMPLNFTVRRMLREDVAVSQQGADDRYGGFRLVMDFANVALAQKAGASACLAFTSTQLAAIMLLPIPYHRCDMYLIGR